MGRLGVGGLLYRYPPGQGYDGIGGRENLFAICSFWCVDCLARQGRLDEAHAMFERLLALRNHAGLYAEEFEATTLRPLGNYPQAFSPRRHDHRGAVARAGRGHADGARHLKAGPQRAASGGQTAPDLPAVEPFERS